ncbi:MAG: hypothetical protein A3H62_03965 [Candidatus Ryanbacteria bacterium RIFCSPLOWO2_02_FULL_44_40]|nr:MAG: hypothetical protein A2718_00385 [Candidatus Ryanbacteria bacterium RIFCSPHIGHO2_01_FULL_44_130]OGZ54530.1 MAG: hypothetical protein A3H62_03965 [Candidatus Ryanbacteria bacterium RIFCSPLOWO2_02_FULL_44_40]
MIFKCRHFDKLSASKEKLVVRQTYHPEFIEGKLSAVRLPACAEAWFGFTHHKSLSAGAAYSAVGSKPTSSILVSLFYQTRTYFRNS